MTCLASERSKLPDANARQKIASIRFTSCSFPRDWRSSVTAFAYGFMAFQAVNAVRAEAGRHLDHPLFQWLRVHGDTALLIELAVLAVLTVGAIATDR